MNNCGLLFDIQGGSFVDGPGIRTTLFFKGCNLRCGWCHNPESQTCDRQLVTDPVRCTGCGLCKKVCPTGGENCTLCGECARLCPADARHLYGRYYTVEQAVREIEKDVSFYRTSGGGATFSGGECMLQIDFLSALLRRCKAEGISTAVDTAGDVPWSDFARILPDTDLFLYDVKCVSPSLHRAGTGRDNRRILQNLRRLSAEALEKIIVRVPVVGGFNDTDGEMQAIAAFLRECGIKTAELLPYHTMGRQKYRMLGRNPAEFSVPSPEAMRRYRALFARL